MRFGSVCSGIEAASVAWEPLGWKAAWFAEIEPFPSAVLAHHYPDVPNLGDMTTIADKVRAGEVEAPDVLVGGTPCQAFSVAGLRNSLDDARGQLSLEFVRLANEIDSARSVRGHAACTVLWENVPGVLSTKDNAFGCFLGALAGEDGPILPAGKKWTNAGCVFGPQRTVAWRVTDAQYFGVAQRRRRVFVVASADPGFDPANVLFESEGVRRDTAPRREPGQDIAATAPNGIGSSGQESLTPWEKQGTRIQGPAGISPTLMANPAGGMKLEPVLSVALRGRDGGATAELGGDVAGCLRASSGGGDKPHVLAFNSNAQADEMRFDPHASAALTCSQYSAVCVTGDITHTLKAEGFDASEDGTGRGQPIVTAFSAKDFGADATAELSPTLRAGGANTSHANSGNWMAIQTGMAVRRLTPVEYARLQGFPDHYLDITFRKKPAADGPKYKALGNSMCVLNMRKWGRQIDAEVRRTRQQEAA